MLLVAIVLLGSIVVTLTGAPALGDTRQSVDVARAEHAMGEVDARVSATALDLDADATRDVEFGRVERQGELRTTGNSWIRVEILNASTGVANEVVNESLGTVAYTNGDTTVAYEGGGVWRSDRGSSVMLSPPEFHYRGEPYGNGTLTLPIIDITGGSDRVLSDQFRVERDGPTTRLFPDEPAGLTNKVSNAKVRVTVKSEYYVAWGRYFQETSNGIVYVDHTNGTASVTYLSVPKWIGLQSGIIATSGLGEIRLQGNSIYIDSYNSSNGSYEETKGAQGSITAANDVIARGDSNIQGDVRSGAVIDLGGTTNINGSVYYTDGFSTGGDAISGHVKQIDGVADIEPIDGYVYETVAEIRETNDNDAADIISGNDLTGPGTLPAGTYYLNDLILGPGDTLVLDTTDGDVTIAVEGVVSIVGNGNSAAGIDVVGPGTATVFVIGDDPVDLQVGKNGRVDVVGVDGEPNVERAGQFRIYGTSDFGADISSNQGNKIHFEGVVYAPAGRTGVGKVEMGQAAFYGAIVTGNLTVKQGSEIHYDLGLSRGRFPRSPTISRLEFMHVTVHPVRVRG